MGFAIRLIVVFGKFLITLVLFALVLYATVWVINKVVQYTADYLGYEVKDFFVWAREKLSKRKDENGKNDNS